MCLVVELLEEGASKGVIGGRGIESQKHHALVL